MGTLTADTCPQMENISLVGRHTPSPPIRIKEATMVVISPTRCVATITKRLTVRSATFVHSGTLSPNELIRPPNALVSIRTGPIKRVYTLTTVLVTAVASLATKTFLAKDLDNKIRSSKSSKIRTSARRSVLKEDGATTPQTAAPHDPLMMNRMMGAAIH